MHIIEETDLKLQNEILRNYLSNGAVGFIYETINTYNNKKYLGRKNFLTPSGKNNGWTNYYGSGVFIKRLLRTKDYKNSLLRKILYIGYSEEKLIEKEQYYLDKFDCVKSHSYYNINKNANGGYSRAGYNSFELEQWSKKMSQKSSNYYINNRDEVKDRVATSNKNRKNKMTDEDWDKYIVNMCNSNGGGNNYWAMKVEILKDDTCIESFTCLQDAYKFMYYKNILKSYTTFHKMRKGYI